jgi:riboflavin kinase/FMN adenylyltransferase
LSLYHPEEFVERILLPIGTREVHVGANFRFGHRRRGNLDTLRELGTQFDFEVFVTETVSFRGQRISSTRIRNLLKQGRVAPAKRLLGRPYEIEGAVVRGAEKGAQLGFPTANLRTDNELIPATGVYVTRTSISGGVHLGATNIGYRPTLYQELEPVPTVETHLLDFEGDLYGQEMRLEFCYRLRGEQKFSSLEHLVRQIGVDLRRTREYAARIEETGISLDR